MALSYQSLEETVMQNIQEKHDPQSDNSKTEETFGKETQLDLETLLHFNTADRQFERKLVEQHHSTCCYGRGKKLADIPLPKLPKQFQNEDFVMAKAGFLGVST